MAMRNVIFVVVLGLVACTKPNPNRCCTDEADCAANDIPVGSSCADGLVCRGNQCIAETCMASSDCESTDPFCVGGLCTASCTDDSQCPGAGDDPSLAHCTGGVCVACAASTDCPASTPACVNNACLECAMDADCPASTPVCDMNTCRACAADAECSSEVCDVDQGTCVEPSTIRYASPTGSETADCSQATPCSAAHALASVDLAHSWVRMLPGTYTAQLTLSAASAQVVGSGATLMGELTLRSAYAGVRGLTIIGTLASSYYAFDCGTSTAALTQVSMQGYFEAIGCHADLEQVLSADSIWIGQGCEITIDRSMVGGIGPQGVTDLGLTVTNSVITGQFGADGIDKGPVNVNISYSTFYCPGCMGGAVADCSTLTSAVGVTFTNDIFLDPGTLSNAVVTDGPFGTNLCTFTNNITYPQPHVIAGNIALDPRLADVTNGDFHLTATSPAIDAAIVTGTDPAIDFDGTSRPQGARDDIGAFEYKP